ncbi:unnamed protein product, partial [Ectocarpus sp. 12 AP-2014]
ICFSWRHHHRRALAFQGEDEDGRQHCSRKIAVRYQALRLWVNEDRIPLDHVSPSAILSDIFTKSPVRELQDGIIRQVEEFTWPPAAASSNSSAKRTRFEVSSYWNFNGLVFLRATTASLHLAARYRRSFISTTSSRHFSEIVVRGSMDAPNRMAVNSCQFVCSAMFSLCSMLPNSVLA